MSKAARCRASTYLTWTLVLGACGGDSSGTPAGDDTRGDAGSDLDGWDASEPDAGEPDASVDAGNTPLCGPSETICHGDTPACVDGLCVECGPNDTSACSASEICNTTTHRCQGSVSDPFSLDCGALRSDGACQGGPREVLLVQERQGRVLMFEPSDGTFLGYFKRESTESEANYWVATQGADQCIWTTGDDRGVERFDTNGTFKDTILPLGRYFEGQDDLIQSPHALAFTAEHVYVASTDGTPNDRLVRFSLAGLASGTQLEPEVVLDDGTQFDSTVLLGDGSFVLRGLDATGRVGSVDHFDPARGERTSILTGLSNQAGQISYAGAGQLLVGDRGTGAMYLASIADGTAKQVTPDGYDQVRGTALLENGRWMFTTRGAIRALDPASVQPEGQSVRLWDDPAVPYGDFRHIGRACLSNEFVEAAKPEPPAADCEAPEGDVLFEENFDSGSLGAFTYVDYTEPENPYEHKVAATIEDVGAEGSAGALKVAYAPGFYDSGELVPSPSRKSGVEAMLGDLRPSYIGYYVRTEDVDADAGYFELNDRDFDGVESIYLTYSDENEGNLSTLASNVSTPVRVGEWMRVQMRNIDWQAQTYDLYVDCERLGDDIPFWLPSEGINHLRLFNYWPRDSAFYDQILMK